MQQNKAGGPSGVQAVMSSTSLPQALTLEQVEGMQGQQQQPRMAMPPAQVAPQAVGFPPPRALTVEELERQMTGKKKSCVN